MSSDQRSLHQITLAGLTNEINWWHRSNYATTGETNDRAIAVGKVGSKLDVESEDAVSVEAVAYKHDSIPHCNHQRHSHINDLLTYCSHRSISSTVLYLSKLQAKDALPNITAWRPPKEAKNAVFFCPSDLDFGLQTRPSSVPKTSSVWIWHKSVQRFPRYSYTNQKI